MEDKFIWWKHGIIYHLYVRSFYDSNNDGIGDIRGIIEKLGYLKDLGIDAVWLSPIFKSPQKDFGYDVEDYQAIDPEYGNFSDFLELLDKAHGMGIKIILDMVLNHTSDRHPWFIESRSSKDNPKRDWYIWKKGRNWRLPNNWKTSFGSKAWCYDRTTNEYYYHSFFREQPDLNWRNEEVKAAMFKQMEFWLDKGVDGFRLDVINFIVKDKKFRNNPILLQQLLLKKNVYNRNRKASISIVQSLRKLLDQHPDTVSIGEIYALPPGDPKIVRKYLGNGEDALHLALDFSLMFTGWNPAKYAQVLQKSYNSVPEKGWNCITMSNHDILRSYSKHLFHKIEKARLMAIILLTSYGTPFIYYGEEIGIPSMPVPLLRIQDSLGKRFWPLYKGRDKLRTPMLWDASSYAGFSDTEPWLPINKNFHEINVAKQANDETSLYSIFKKLIELRKNHETLQKGDWQITDVSNSKVLAYKRRFKDTEIFVCLNFSNRPQPIKIQHMPTIFSTHSIDHDEILKPFEGRITCNENTVK